MEEYHKLYPQLSEGGETFRLQTVSKYFSDLEAELKSRELTLEKYKKFFKSLVNISAIAGTLSVVLSASGTGTALTGVGLPVGASLASLATLCGLLSVSTGASLKRVIRKVNKHEQIVTLCRNTISSINTSVSRALSDNVISNW